MVINLLGMGTNVDLPSVNEGAGQRGRAHDFIDLQQYIWSYGCLAGKDEGKGTCKSYKTLVDFIN